MSTHSPEFTQESIKKAWQPMQESLRSIASTEPTETELPDASAETQEFTKYFGETIAERDALIRKNEGFAQREDGQWQNAWRRSGNNTQHARFVKLTESIRAGCEVSISRDRVPHRIGSLQKSMVTSWYRNFGQLNTTDNAYAILEQAANRLEVLADLTPEEKYIEANMLLEAAESNARLDLQIRAVDWQKETVGRAKELLMQSRQEFLAEFAEHQDGKHLKRYIDAEAKLYDLEFASNIKELEIMSSEEKKQQIMQTQYGIIAEVNNADHLYSLCKDNKQAASGALAELAYANVFRHALLQFPKTLNKIRIRSAYEREDRAGFSEQPSNNFDLAIEIAAPEKTGFGIFLYPLQLKTSEQHSIVYNTKNIDTVSLGEVFKSSAGSPLQGLLESFRSNDPRGLNPPARELLAFMLPNADFNPRSLRGKLATKLESALKAQ